MNMCLRRGPSIYSGNRSEQKCRAVQLEWSENRAAAVNGSGGITHTRVLSPLATHNPTLGFPDCLIVISRMLPDQSTGAVFHFPSLNQHGAERTR
jgi:hypothetical protein